MKGLLFIDGEPPKDLPDHKGYDVVACTDGAFMYLDKMGFSLENLDFISGDLDSMDGMVLETIKHKIIQTPDQEDTDFQKALKILVEKGCSEVDVYGASGGEQDHYLGNLSAGLEYKNKLKIRFYDDYSTYFFIDNHYETNGVLGKMISLYPFPEAENIVTKGLKWPLNKEKLKIGSRIGTRNVAVEDSISIDFQGGELLIFVGKN